MLRTTSSTAFFSVWRLLAVPNIRPNIRPGVGLDIERVARLDLRTGEVATAIDMNAYREKNDGWISEILDVDDDDRTLLCRTASRRAPDGHPTGGFGYWLSRVDLETLEVEHISYLRHVVY